MLINSRMLCGGGKVRKLIDGGVVTDPNKKEVNFIEQNLNNFDKTPNLFGLDRNTDVGRDISGLSEIGQKEAFQQFENINPFHSLEGQGNKISMQDMIALSKSGALRQNLDAIGDNTGSEEFLRSFSDNSQKRFRGFATNNIYPGSLSQDTIEGIRTQNASPVPTNRHGGRFTIVKRFEKGGKFKDIANQF